MKLLNQNEEANVNQEIIDDLTALSVSDGRRELLGNSVNHNLRTGQPLRALIACALVMSALIVLQNCVMMHKTKF